MINYDILLQILGIIFLQFLPHQPEHKEINMKWSLLSIKANERQGPTGQIIKFLVLQYQYRNKMKGWKVEMHFRTCGVWS